jgi:hypothetical protein
VTGNPRIPRVPRLPLAEWPDADAAAWKRACTPCAGPFSQNPPRSLGTYGVYGEAYAGYLWHLRSLNQLDPAETPAQRVRIPTQGGQVFRSDPGHCSDLMAATIPI